MLKPGDIAFCGIGSIMSYKDVHEFHKHGTFKIESTYRPKYGDACLVISRKTVDVTDYSLVLTNDRLVWVDERFLAMNLQPLVKHDD